MGCQLIIVPVQQWYSVVIFYCCNLCFEVVDYLNNVDDLEL
jgi:hypothetical protein